MDATYELLKAHPFVGSMTAYEVSRLAEHTTPTLFAANTRLFDEGRDAETFWLIREGHVRLDALIPGRGPVVVETLGPGSVLGWSWLFPPRRWHFGAQTISATHALQLDGRAVRDLCDRMPELGYKLMTGFLQVVVDRLQNTRIRLLDLYGDAT
ncbi:MAG TPA: cyclic nucleotide-binding domain-containing protein [Micromonosporaceae bacterium]|jgi:CRP-like cAMP-binding protein|nr:cyclic nucleotide-binding domain-containing protein [Micromonosporaceae bacterium]